MQSLNTDNASELVMTSLDLDKHVFGRCDKEEVEDKYLQYMTHSQMLGKFEYTGGPIFKVVLEC